MFKSTLLLTTL